MFEIKKNGADISSLCSNMYLVQDKGKPSTDRSSAASFPSEVYGAQDMTWSNKKKKKKLNKY